MTRIDIVRWNMVLVTVQLSASMEHVPIISEVSDTVIPDFP